MNQMIGSIPEFNSGRDDWDVYHERLEQFFEVNDVPEVKRSAFLISVIGADSYKSLRDLCHPVVPKDKGFGELCELLRKQFSPQVSVFRERAKFYNASHENHENVTQWYGRLKRLSVDCRFGDSLQAVLLDKFITGLRAGQVLDRLCEEGESLKLEQALEIAVNKECAAKESAFVLAKPRPCSNPFAGGCVPPPLAQPRVFFEPLKSGLPISPRPSLGYTPPQHNGLFGGPARPFGAPSSLAAPRSFVAPAVACAFGSAAPASTFGAPAPPAPPSSSLFGTSSQSAIPKVSNDSLPCGPPIKCTFGTVPEPPVAAVAPAFALFESSAPALGASNDAEAAEPIPEALAYSAPMKLKTAVRRLATQHSEEPVEETSEKLDFAAEEDGLPLGGAAGRGRGGRRVRTRRRGRGRGTAAAGEGDASGEGEKKEV